MYTSHLSIINHSLVYLEIQDNETRFDFVDVLYKKVKGKCTGKVPEAAEPAEPQPEKATGNPMGIVALLLVFGLVGGGAFYYFKVVKNKAKPQSNPNVNEYDFSDDEDDEDEYGYEPAEEEQEETAEESEDDVK